jgi:hypothetical protein
MNGVAVGGDEKLELTVCTELKSGLDSSPPHMPVHCIPSEKILGLSSAA